MDTAYSKQVSNTAHTSQLCVLWDDQLRSLEIEQLVAMGIDIWLCHTQYYIDRLIERSQKLQFDLRRTVILHTSIRNLNTPQYQLMRQLVGCLSASCHRYMYFTGPSHIKSQLFINCVPYASAFNIRYAKHTTCAHDMTALKTSTTICQTSITTS